jgi:t-SNARE complex subunit (syntaxin)|tara:strand:- start:446 stop:670 length:225 start_codon:yes stop_codon:yes gene_type:complete
MTNEKQVAINALWEKYAKILEMFNDTLDELEKKPKEVEVIVEVEADVNLTTPQAVADLERKVQDKLSKHERHGD